jgi:plasmid stability protein
MPNLTIKEIPELLLEQLRQRAAHHRHSINREVILCLGRATELPVLQPSRWLVDADRLRARLDLPPLAEQVLRPQANRARRESFQSGDRRRATCRVRELRFSGFHADGSTRWCPPD